MALPKKCYSMSVMNTNKVDSPTGNIGVSYTDCCSGEVYQLQVPAQSGLNNIIVDTPSLNTPNLIESNVKDYDCASGLTSQPLPPNQIVSPCGQGSYWNGSYCAPIKGTPPSTELPSGQQNSLITSLQNVPMPGNLEIGNLAKIALVAVVGYGAYKIFFN
jgi:hypothetical protein